MAGNKDNVKLVEFNFSYNNADQGFLVSAQTQTSPGTQYVDVINAAQFNGILKTWRNGFQPTLTITMLESDYNKLIGQLGVEQFYPIIDGSKLGWGMGSKQKELFGKQAVLHPVDADADDYAGDIMFWKAVPDFGQANIGGNRDEAQTVVVPFKILPDTNMNPNWDYGIIGDWTATETDPQGIFTQFNDKVVKPFKHTPAISIDSNQTLQKADYGFWAQDSGVTAAVNDIGDIAATDKTIEIDTISITNGLAIGDYIIIDSEYMEITDITYSTATAANATVIRGIGGTVAAIHLNDAVITKQKDVFILNVTRRAAHTSGTPASATVGDSNVLNNKGLITWVAAGSSSIDCLLGATTSQALLVTTTAT
ncbi:MAG: hypothetical protein ACYS1A_17100 [Planctomycetota bacterium]|jgi:hypothetical protein